VLTDGKYAASLDTLFFIHTYAFLIAPTPSQALPNPDSKPAICPPRARAPPHPLPLFPYCYYWYYLAAVVPVVAPTAESPSCAQTSPGADERTRANKCLTLSLPRPLPASTFPLSAPDRHWREQRVIFYLYIIMPGTPSCAIASCGASL
jgi:hypothetical protein